LRSSPPPHLGQLRYVPADMHGGGMGLA